MNLPSTPGRGACFAAFGLSLVLSGALSAKTKPAVSVDPAESVVELSPFLVEGSRVYLPQEPDWKMAELPGFRVYSHGSGATKRIMEELQVVRAAAGVVWGDPRLLGQIVSVVVCDNEPEFLRWANVPPVAFDRLARAVRTPSGVVVVLNGADNTIHRAAGRAYIHGLLDGSSLPRWMQEGLAAIINSAEMNGDRLVVGKVDIDPMDAVPLDHLHELAMSEIFTHGEVVDHGNLDPLAVEVRGRRVEFLVDGMPPTVGDMPRVRELVETQIGQREERLTKAHGDTSFTGYLTDSIAMDLEKLFDPKAEETLRWRMNAWAFLHLSLFGEKSRYRPALAQFVRTLQQQPERAPAEVFAEAFGESPGRFELRMQTYARGGKFYAMDFKLERPFEPKAPDLKPLPESSALLLKARLYGATGRAEAAREFLKSGYVEPSNRTPNYVVVLAQALRTSDREQALQVLDAAEQKGKLETGGQRLQAELRLEKLTAAHPRLTPGEVAQVLAPLFAALNAGDTTEHLFVLIGRAWQASATPPNDGQLNALRLGLRYYPQSAQIGALLAQLEGKG